VGGGPLPLGYELRDGKIVVIKTEAEQVRLIYRCRLELTGVNALVRDLQPQHLRTKVRRLPDGTIRGGIPTTQLSHIRSNRAFAK